MTDQRLPNLYVVSGAGLSMESGLAGFRTPGGIWAKHDMQVVCEYSTWKDNREQVFDFYRACREGVAQAEPNAAHRTLARWQRQWGSDRVHLLTQNVDDLLERAGAQAVTHLHGDLKHLQCEACGHRWRVSLEQYTHTTRCASTKPDGRSACQCLRAVKPAVVLFGEPAPEYQKLTNMAQDLYDLDALLVVGTSMKVVRPSMLIRWHREGHRLNLQVNPQPVASSLFGRIEACGASEGLARLEPLIEQVMERRA